MKLKVQALIVGVGPGAVAVSKAALLPPQPTDLDQKMNKVSPLFDRAPPTSPLSPDIYLRNGSTPHTADKNRVRLLSYNIFMRSYMTMPCCKPCRTNGQSEYISERTRMFIDNYSGNYDVIALQELYGSLCGTASEEFFAREARKKGFNVLTGPRADHLRCKPRFAIADGGLAILSRYDIAASDFQLYSAGTSHDKGSLKGVLYALLDLGDGKKLHVFSTHMQATYDEAGYPETREARKSQSYELATFMQEKLQECDGDFPAVLCGDFNIDARPTKSDTAQGEIDSAEYKSLKDILTAVPAFTDMQDVLFNAHKMHPSTLWNTLLPKDELLVPIEEWDGSIELDAALDHKFFFPNGANWCQVEEDTAKVQTFEVRENEMFPGLYLSDHSGVESCLKINQNI